MYLVNRELVSSNDSAVGAGIHAGTAVQASAGVDHELIVTLRDSASGAGISASTAADASRSNLIGHGKHLHKNCNLIVAQNFENARAL